MKKPRLLFVYNPNAGKAKVGVSLARFISNFSEAGYEVIAYPTKKRLDAKETVKDYLSRKACDRVVCAGGDGTLNEVVNGMMESGHAVPLGYIPAGTTNDFAHSLGIPTEKIKASMVAVSGNLFVCDVGKFQDNFFTYTAAFGLFTDVSYDTPQNFKNAFGRTAYILSGISKLTQIKSYKMTVQHDEETVTGEFIYGMVANTDSVGGFHHLIKREVKLDDGYFEMLLVHTPQNLLDLQEIITELSNGKLDDRYITYAKVNKVTFESENAIPWTLDGEFGGEHTLANVEIIPRAIPYIVK